MKKRIRLFIVSLLLFLLVIPNVYAKNQVNLYLFWGDGCPHCAAEQEYLESLEKDFDNLKIIKYEVWNHEENRQFLNEIATKTNQTMTGVPVTIIGQTIIKGFSTPTEQQLKRAIEYYIENPNHDIVQEIKDGTYKQTENPQEDKFTLQEKEINKDTTIKLPIIKNINFKNYDLQTAIPILGLLASISLPTIWLLITFITTVSLQENKTTKLRLLTLGLGIITITSILHAFIPIKIDWISKVIILIISILLAINNLKTIPRQVSKIATIVLAIAIGFLSQIQYWNILTTLIDIQNIQILGKILSILGYILSYIIPYIIVVLLYHYIWKKLSNKHKNILQISVFIVTILTILFI